VVVAGFDGDVFDSGSWDVAIEVVEVGIFFKVEPWDIAIHKTVTVREMAVEFVNVVDDRIEISVNTSAITEPVQTELGERRHYRMCLWYVVRILLLCLQIHQAADFHLYAGKLRINPSIMRSIHQFTLS